MYIAELLPIATGVSLWCLSQLKNNITHQSDVVAGSNRRCSYWPLVATGKHSYNVVLATLHSYS